MALPLTLLFRLIRNTLKSQYEMSPGLIDVFLIEELTGQQLLHTFVHALILIAIPCSAI